MTLAFVLFLLLVVLATADGVTTHKILSTPGGRELNPVLRWMIEKLGLLPALVWSRLAVFAAGYFMTLAWQSYGVLVLIALCASFGAVVYSNLQVINRQKGSQSGTK